MKCLFYAFFLFLLSSCAVPKNMVYFSDADRFMHETIKQNYVNKIQKNDILSIVVGSKNPELVIPFNPSTSTASPVNPLVNQFTLVSYLVDTKGEIVFPILGRLKVDGLTHSELSELMEKKIIDGLYVNDPTVTVQLINYKISILGEVNRPGVQKIDSDRITIYEALSLAGDLTIFGVRDNISIIREENGERVIADVDISNKEIFDSPYYYLRPNDVVYVEPNKRKKKTSDRNPSTTSAILSALSLLVSTVNFIVR